MCKEWVIDFISPRTSFAWKGGEVWSSFSRIPVTGVFLPFSETRDYPFVFQCKISLLKPTWNCAQFTVTHFTPLNWGFSYFFFFFTCFSRLSPMTMLLDSAPQFPSLGVGGFGTPRHHELGNRDPGLGLSPFADFISLGCLQDKSRYSRYRLQPRPSAFTPQATGYAARARTPPRGTSWFLRRWSVQFDQGLSL